MGKNVTQEAVTGRIDDISNSSVSMKYYRTNYQTTADVPPHSFGHSEEYDAGSVIYMDSASVQKGCQLWLQHQTGDLWVRPRVSESQWGIWKVLASSRTSPANSIIKPEVADTLTDANIINESGIYRTTDSTTNLPDNDKKWGVLQHFLENAQTGAGFQLYAPIDGTGRGSLYIRVFTKRDELQTLNWNKLNIRKILELQDQVYSHPTTEIQSVDAKTPTGFYLTTVNTQGLDGIPQDKKDGVLKVTKDGDISLQRYQPSIAGSTDVYIRTITSSVSTSAREVTDVFKRLNTAHGNLDIIDSRSLPVPSPDDYKSKSGESADNHGFTMFEWKWDNANGVNPPEVERGKRCIIQTFEPVPKDIGVGDADHTDMMQIAYFKDGGIYQRHGSQGGNTWGNWNQISSGSGGSSPATFDINNELTNEINKWIKGQQESSKTKYEEFHKQQLIAMFDSWYKN